MTMRWGWRALAGVLVSVSAGCGGDGAARASLEAPWFVDGTRGEHNTILLAEIGVGSSSCNELESVSAIETQDTIEIRAIVTVAVEGDCTSDFEVVSVEVPLDAPWGNRELIGCQPEGPLKEGFNRPLGFNAVQCFGM